MTQPADMQQTPPTSDRQDPQSAPGAGAPARVQSPAEREPVIKLFIVAAIVLGAGFWCFLDDSNHKYYNPVDTDATKSPSPPTGSTSTPPTP